MSKALEIQKIICSERKKQKKTYKELASEIGCTQRSIVKWNAGETKISIDMADMALKALGISVTIGKEKEK